MRITKALLGCALAASLLAAGSAANAATASGSTSGATATEAKKAQKQARRHRANRKAKLNLRAVAATYLGLDKATIRAKIESGMTLGEIADATQGKSSSGLRAALIAAVTRRLDARLAVGRITEERRAELLAAMEKRIDALIAGTAPVGRQAGPGQAGDHGNQGGPGAEHAHADLRAATEAYLGLDDATIRTQLDAGKSLGEVADATAGKSAAGLKDALVAAITTFVNAEVAAGRMTADEKAKVLADAPTRIDEMPRSSVVPASVAGTSRAGRFGRSRRGPSGRRRRRSLVNRARGAGG